MNEILNLATGNLGSILILFFLWKSGFLKDIGVLKNGNGDYKRLQEEVSLIKDNHLHEINETLKRIENGQRNHIEKTDKVSENLIYIKARLNGKNRED